MEDRPEKRNSDPRLNPKTHTRPPLAHAQKPIHGATSRGHASRPQSSFRSSMYNPAHPRLTRPAFRILLRALGPFSLYPWIWLVHASFHAAPVWPTRLIIWCVVLGFFKPNCWVLGPFNEFWVGSVDFWWFFCPFEFFWEL